MDLAFLGYLGGLGWTTRFSWPVVYSALFVVAVAYAISFVTFKGKLQWLLAGAVCGVVQVLIFIPTMIQRGTNWQSVSVMVVEWFAVGSIAALLALLVPTDRPKKAGRGTTYY